MKGSDDFLFPLFDDLRRRGLPLGVSEYEAAVKCLWAGVGLESPAHLRETLSMIWAKSREDRALLHDRFRIILAPLLYRRPVSERETATDGLQEEMAGDGQAPQTGTFGMVVMKPGGKPAAPEFLLRQGPGVGRPDLEPEKDRFQFIPRFPVRRREMTVVFRGLRLMRRIGAPEELDIDATIDGIGETGFFTGPVLRPLRKNTAFLLTLTDRKGSMDPFLPLTENLLESVLKGGMLGRVRTMYFHNIPGDKIYENPELTMPVSTEDVICERAPRPCVMIVSDAGAAKGYFDEKRARTTAGFIKKLNETGHRSVWINPVPPERWQGTTAQDIEKTISMFPLTREGLKDAVDLLRGRSVAPGAYESV